MSVQELDIKTITPQQRQYLITLADRKKGIKSFKNPTMGQNSNPNVAMGRGGGGGGRGGRFVPRARGGGIKPQVKVAKTKKASAPVGAYGYAPTGTKLKKAGLEVMGNQMEVHSQINSQGSGKGAFTQEELELYQ